MWSVQRQSIWPENPTSSSYTRPLDGTLCQDHAGPMGEPKKILRKYLLPEFSAQPGASKVKG